MNGVNRVHLEGKITRRGSLKYTPGGTAICEFTIAVPQKCFERKSMGQLEIMMIGNTAEECAPILTVGKRLSLQGSLWTRSFMDRKGVLVKETKILAESIDA